MSKKLPVNRFKWLDSAKHVIDEEFIKNSITKTIKKDIFSK